MQIKITWPKTGDTLLFDAMNHNVAKWFVEQCEKLGNSFVDYHHVQINPARPYKLGAPIDFILWCQEHNIVPHNVNLPIGNLVDWKNNLTKARSILRVNREQKDNYFNFSII
jgi:hypothetical protein